MANLKIFEAGPADSGLYYATADDRLSCVRRCNDAALLQEVVDAAPGLVQKVVQQAAYARVRKLRHNAGKEPDAKTDS